MDRVGTSLQDSLEQIRQRSLADGQDSLAQPVTEAQYDCPHCRDSEFIITRDAEGLPLARRCECHQRKNLKRLIRSSMLTNEMQEWTFDNYNPDRFTKELYEAAKDYAQNFDEIKQGKNNGFGFIGPVGVGKTHLMAAIANTILQKFVRLIFVNTVSLIYELRLAEFQRDNLEDINQKVYQLQNSDVVLFDDLAKEKSTEWTQMQYYRIIDHRYIHRLPTGWTTNCSLGELAEKLGEATTSRLVQMAGGRIIQVSPGASDYRTRGV